MTKDRPKDVADAITPDPIEIDYPTILGFEAPHLCVYPRETVIAEKYQAMMMLGIANSRMKDFFDIWVPKAYRHKPITNAMLMAKKKSRNRTTHDGPCPIERVNR